MIIIPVNFNPVSMSELVHHDVLLVEDHAPLILIATTMLDELGYSYLVAANGAEGVEQFKIARFHLILMDIHMPLLGGIETTRQIRLMEQERNQPRTPIVAMTAHIASADMDQCVEAGMDDIIPKPVNPKYFSKILKKYKADAA